MITRTVKVPEELIKEIDQHIDANEYSTRADFVLHALRETVEFYAEKKRIAIEECNGGLPSKSDIADSFRGCTDSLMEWSSRHKGDMVQINTRVPEGLEMKIELLLKPEYGFKRKSDFTRVAIEHLLMVLRESDMVFHNEERYAKRQKEITEILDQELAEGAAKGLPIEEVLKTFQEKLQQSGYID